MSSGSQASLLVVLPIATATVTAYAFNSQVYQWVGEGATTSKLFQLWLGHIGGVAVLPYFLAIGRDQSGRVVSGYCGRPGKSWARLSAMSVVASCFQMVIYYLWYLAAVRIPAQVLAAIFQTTIALVYVLSIAVLGEKPTWAKSAGVCLAVAGVITASSYSEPGPEGPERRLLGAKESFGVIFALLAEVSKASYQVWFKVEFGSPSVPFLLFFAIAIAAAHVVVILPLLAAGHYLGFEDARIYISVGTPAQGRLVALAVMISSFVNVGSLATIALRSPLFWSSYQMLIIPASVLFDYAFRGILPARGGVVGYLLIFAAFLLLSELVALAPAPATRAEEGGSSVELARRA